MGKKLTTIVSTSDRAMQVIGSSKLRR